MALLLVHSAVKNLRLVNRCHMSGIFGGKSISFLRAATHFPSLRLGFT